MRSTFRILFYINRCKGKNGMVPIMGRITLNGTVAHFSCRIQVFEPFWEVSSNRAVLKPEKYKTKYHTIDDARMDVDTINNQLDIIRAKIVSTYQSSLFVHEYLTARRIKEKTFCISNENETLLHLIDKDIVEYLPRVNKDRSLLTYRKMIIVKNHLKNFIMRTHKVADIYLIDLKSDFLREFYNYIVEYKHLKKSTAWVYCCYLKKIVLHAYCQGIIHQNPFYNVKISPNIPDRNYLTEEELNKLIEYKTEDPLSCYVRDLFVFSCFTGISFVDILSLRSDNIVNANDEIWIAGHRQKSMVPYYVRLLQIPKAILQKYYGNYRNKIFDEVTNSIVNKKLKLIVKECHIEKNITFHCARHTFATLALTYGMPIESVSKILGHTNITTTQVYAKITNLKISLDIDGLEKAIQGKFSGIE